MPTPKTKKWISIAAIALIGLPILNIFYSLISGYLTQKGMSLLSDRSCLVEQKLEFPSPNGHMLALAELKQCDRPHNRSAIVMVQERGSRRLIHAVTLSIPFEDQVALGDLVQPRWTDNKHLNITYHKVANVFPGPETYNGVRISLTDSLQSARERREQLAWKLIRKSYPEVTPFRQQLDISEVELPKDITGLGRQGEQVLLVRVFLHGELMEEYMISPDKEKAYRISKGVPLN